MSGSGAGRRRLGQKAPDGRPGGEDVLVKYMILIYGSQQDYDALAGKPAAGQPGCSPADFAALG